jgi:hypothetical protein
MYQHYALQKYKEYIWKQVAFVPCMMHVILPHAQPMLQGHPEIFVMGAILG